MTDPYVEWFNLGNRWDGRVIGVLSSTHFNRRFRQRMRMTPMYYLHTTRMQAFQRLLTTIPKSLVEIAVDVGYTDPWMKKPGCAVFGFGPICDTSRTGFQGHDTETMSGYPASSVLSVRVIHSVNWALALGIDSHCGGGQVGQNSG